MVEGPVTQQHAPNVQHSLMLVRSQRRLCRRRWQVPKGLRGEEEGVDCAGEIDSAVLEVGQAEELRAEAGPALGGHEAGEKDAQRKPAAIIPSPPRSPPLSLPPFTAYFLLLMSVAYCPPNHLSTSARLLGDCQHT